MNQDAFHLIAERAYLLAESQGFAPGRELDFWLQAEAEIVPAPPTKAKRATRKTSEALTNEAPEAAAAIITKPRARTRKVAV